MCSATGHVSFAPIATAKADSRKRSCLLYPRKRTCALQGRMSAKGQKRTRATQQKRDFDRAIADTSEAIQLDPKSANALAIRGEAYRRKGDYHRAIADLNKAIRLNANDPGPFCNRGVAKLKINDSSGHADIAKARQLDSSGCR